MKNYVIAALIVVATCLCIIEPPGRYDYIEHTVRPGQTVWEICERYYPAQAHCLQEFVYETQKINKLEGKYIRPGQRLTIPLWVRVKEEK